MSRYVDEPCGYSPYDPIPLSPDEVAVASNDEPVAMIVVHASGWVTSEYVCALDTFPGIHWLERRLDQARAALGVPECRVPATNGALVCQASSSSKV